MEWNDQYRDEIRDFWRGHSSGIRTVATRLAGSSDLYADDGRSPYASVNFVTAHDGFTVRDLVTYEHKHNEANGEDNRDGTDNNRSWNHGVEGETDDPAIVALRRRQAANLMATLCLSNGVPMITAGDERGRTQRGNNNAYCQDNEISWIDWRPDDAWLDVYEITKTALRLRREHPALRQRHWFEGRPTIRGGPKDLAWLHPSGREMTADDWHDTDLRAIGMFVSGAPLRSPGPRGEQQVDRSFVLWLNSDCDSAAVRISLPENDWVHSRRGRALHRRRPARRHPGQGRRPARPRPPHRRRDARDLSRPGGGPHLGCGAMFRPGRSWVRSLVSRAGYDVQRVRQGAWLVQQPPGGSPSFDAAARRVREDRPVPARRGRRHVGTAASAPARAQQPPGRRTPRLGVAEAGDQLRAGRRGEPGPVRPPTCVSWVSPDGSPHSSRCRTR